MPYAEIPPTAALRPWVECFWTVRDDAPRVQRVLPDGCADLVFDLAAGRAIAVGTMTRAFEVESPGPSNFLGVRFRPGRAAAFLRIPLAEITDARVPLRELWRDDAGIDTIARLESELIRRLRPDRDARVDAAVDAIVSGAGRVDQLAERLGISRQHLARQFRHHVGVSPKTFARVMRFRRAIGSLTPDVEWADLALCNGYYDQSHLIAEFRELAGTTPAAFHSSNR